MLIEYMGEYKGEPEVTKYTFNCGKEIYLTNDQLEDLYHYCNVMGLIESEDSTGSEDTTLEIGEIV